MGKLVFSRTSRYTENCPLLNGAPMEDSLMIWPQPDDTKVVVTLEEQGRLDMVASRVYKNPLLWWVLARRNGIQIQDEVRAGDVLWVPTIQNTYTLGGILGESTS